MDGVDLSKPTGPSHVVVRNRFSAAEAAQRYPATYGRCRRHRCERRAILRALAYVPKGAWVLDLPCGTGRGTRLLLESGYRVTAADASSHMLAAARENYRRLRAESSWQPAAMFEVCDVMATGFPANHFDAVFCNRLLHHFREPEGRRAALREFARISRGPVIASFFNVWALDSLGAWVRHLVWGPDPGRRLSRQAISLRTFTADVEAAGLKIAAKIAARPGISRQCYVVCRKAHSSPA